MSFATLGLPALVLRGVRAAGYNEPTPIQRKAIPLILEGNDVIGAAQAGTGKTAAYLLPTLARLLEGYSKLRALVLTPTRELAAQVETTARSFARFTELRVGVVYPGVPIGPQERTLREHGVDLLVATPNRLLELHAREALRFDDVEILVLDEGDRMVETGFGLDLRKILKLLPETRQTVIFSATMPPELNRLAKDALVDPIRVDLAPSTRTAAGITEAIYPVPRELKTHLLNDMLARMEVRSTIVFTRTRLDADRLLRHLARIGFSVAPLHGSRSQSQRLRALADLRRGRVQILVATELASRGIDVQGVSHVVNYDVPHTPEDYVHRLGRGAETAGDAFTLMSPEEQKDVEAIERFLGRTVPRVLLPDFDYKMRPREIQQVLSYNERAGTTSADGSKPVVPAARPRPHANPARGDSGHGPRKPPASGKGRARSAR